MAPPDPPDWAAEIAAATAWWQEAGVEHGFAETPRDWLAGAKRPPSVEAAVPAAPSSRPATAAVATPRIGGEPARWPRELAGFADWWLTEPSLDPVPGAPRVLPAGPAGAPLMVLVAQPEEQDRELLLAGRQGRLLDATLAAFGLARAEIYLASVLPRFTPATDWAALADTGMREVIAHHVALAAPARLLVFGQAVSSLVGHDPAQAPADSREFYHEGGSVPLLVAPALETLLERPARKQGVWTRWLDWTGTG